MVWENEKSFQFGIDEGLLPRAKGRCLSGTLSALPAPFVGNFHEIFEKQNGGRRFGFRLVFKVAGKIFAITDIDKFESINLKCDPEKAEDLRARYNAIQPGYHMNKKHWNTVVNHSDVNDKLLKQMIDDSYNLVIQGLPKKTKLELGL